MHYRECVSIVRLSRVAMHTEMEGRKSLQSSTCKGQPETAPKVGTRNVQGLSSLCTIIVKINIVKITQEDSRNSSRFFSHRL